MDLKVDTETHLLSCSDLKYLEEKILRASFDLHLSGFAFDEIVL